MMIWHLMALLGIMKLHAGKLGMLSLIFKPWIILA